LTGLKLATGILADKLPGGNRLAKLNVHLWAKKKSAARAADFHQVFKQL
jgi:hypothetical protein